MNSPELRKPTSSLHQFALHNPNLRFPTRWLPGVAGSPTQITPQNKSTDCIFETKARPNVERQWVRSVQQDNEQGARDDGWGRDDDRLCPRQTWQDRHWTLNPPSCTTDVGTEG